MTVTTRLYSESNTNSYSHVDSPFKNNPEIPNARLTCIVTRLQSHGLFLALACRWRVLRDIYAVSPSRKPASINACRTV
jgi:hypothetical protein